MVERAAIASQRVRSSGSCHLPRIPTTAKAHRPALFERTVATAPRAVRGRGTVQAGPRVRGRSPCLKQTTAGRRTTFQAERGATPKGARSQPGGRSRNGAWGNWLQARQPAQRGAEGEGQGGNAPGCKVPPGVRERARPHAERLAGCARTDSIEHKLGAVANCSAAFLAIKIGSGSNLVQGRRWSGV
jgi:hypothetical protein